MQPRALQLQSITIFIALFLIGLSLASGPKGPDENGFYWLESEGIRAAFIPYGASIAQLHIADQDGVIRDVVAGYDNASHYSSDATHPHLGGVPGRYANRIQNASFSIDGITYHADANEHAGLNTLHGGRRGWDWRNFTVQSHTEDTIVFALVDDDGAMGFPGEVLSYIRYEVQPYRWDFTMTAVPTSKKTPIMLTSHTYWNLDGWANDATATALDHSLWLPYSGMRVATDGILVPTGDLLANQPGSVNDFWTTPKQIGRDFGTDELEGNCGPGCTGYDTCYLINRPGSLASYSPLSDDSHPAPLWSQPGNFVARLHSPWSGIQLDVYTDQAAFQMYSCGGQNGKMPLKRTQGLSDNPKFPRTIQQYGCVVMEVQDWIDAINQPAWQRNHIYGPDDSPYVVQASYRFSVNESLSG